jgi:DNA-binding CsgD family transcriptional regulator
MANVLFLPNESSVIWLQSALPADTLIAQVNSGKWQPPAPYATWLLEGRHTLNCAVFGNLVIIQVDQPGSAPAFPPEMAGPALSSREMEVLQWMAEGMKQVEIARDLGLSVRTVASYIHRIKSRFGVRTIAQTLGRAAALGLVRMRRRE